MFLCVCFFFFPMTWIHVRVCSEVAVLTRFCIAVACLAAAMYSLTFHFALSWTEAVSSLRLNWHLSYYFLLPLVIMKSISVSFGCCIARLSVLSPHYTEMLSEPVELPGSSTVVWHLDTTYIYIYGLRGELARLKLDSALSQGPGLMPFSSLCELNSCRRCFHCPSMTG